jgi:3-hydroxyacyl-CoA dehydrogenase
MRWGFAHEAGPFEMWDMLGVAETVEKMEEAGLEVAPWVKEMLAAGCDSFYQNGSCYDWNTKSYQPHPRRQKHRRHQGFARRGQRSGGQRQRQPAGHGRRRAALRIPRQDERHRRQHHQPGPRRRWRSWTAILTPWSLATTPTTSAWARICFAVGVAAASGHWDVLDKMIHDLQSLTFNLRHAPKPVVTAVQGMALGGGVEMALAGWETVANHESYMGLVEVGVGLIPAGGGCKEVLRRKVNPTMRTANADPVPVMQAAFEQIGLAKVGDQRLGKRRTGLPDSRRHHRHERRPSSGPRQGSAPCSCGIGARPPEVEKIYAAGRDVYSALVVGVKSLNWGGYASDHDVVIAKKLAYILTGGGSAPRPGWTPGTSWTWSGKCSSPCWAKRKRASA